MLRLFIKKFVINAQVRCNMIAAAKWPIYPTIRRAFRIPHEKEFAAIPLFNVDKNSLFLDVGAHLGQSVDSIRLYAPESPIISFEPNTILTEILRRKFKKDKNLVVEECALGSTDSQATFFIPVYLRYAFTELASTVRPNIEEFKRVIWNFKDKYFSIIEQTWLIRRLDTFKLKPFFIKIDGAVNKLEFVKGGLETLSNHKPIIMVEGVSYEGDLRKMLEPLGYQMYRYEKGQFIYHESLIYHAFLIPPLKMELLKQKGLLKAE